MDSSFRIPFYNGESIPIIGLGTWQSSPDEIETAITEAIDIGYRHFDTAFLYGNEEAIGTVFHKLFQAGKVKREEIFVTTKLPLHGMRRDLVKHFLELSLRRLQLDYIDLYLIHNPMGLKYIGDEMVFPSDENGKLIFDYETNHLEIWKGMEELVDLGLAKSIGVSNFNLGQLQRLLSNCRIKPANLQVECHVYLQQQAIISFCKSHNISVVAYGPIGSPGKKAMDEKRGVTSVYANLMEDPVVLGLAKKHNKTPAQVLLRFLTQNNISVIPKSINPTRIKENFSIFDFTISEEEMKQLRGLDKNMRLFQFEFVSKHGTHPEWPF